MVLGSLAAWQPLPWLAGCITPRCHRPPTPQAARQQHEASTAEAEAKAAARVAALERQLEEARRQGAAAGEAPAELTQV